MSITAADHNLSSLLIGTGEFSFALNATTPAQAAAQGYKDFGNVTAVSINPEGEMKEHFGSYRGVVRRDDLRKRKIKLGYKLTSDEFTQNNLSYAFFGTTGGDNARAALGAVAGSALPFTATPAVLGLWYDLRDAGGNRVTNLSAVTFTGKTEGTDFVVDTLLGRVKFLTAQSADLTPMLSASAITSSSTSYMRQIAPLQQGLFSGIGRLACYDEKAGNNLVFDHRDFGCQVTIDGNPDVKQDDYSTLSLMVSISNPVGSVYVREV